ncbi:uncharacterized protein METZ01_LOCUS405946, partial [marine metagenome]
MFFNAFNLGRLRKDSMNSKPIDIIKNVRHKERPCLLFLIVDIISLPVSIQLNLSVPNISINLDLFTLRF